MLYTTSLYYIPREVAQREVQWTQGVVMYMMLYASSLYNTTPIRCIPPPTAPPCNEYPFVMADPYCAEQFCQVSSYSYNYVSARLLDNLYDTYMYIYIYIYAYTYMLFCPRGCWTTSATSGRTSAGTRSPSCWWAQHVIELCHLYPCPCPKKFHKLPAILFCYTNWFYKLAACYSPASKWGQDKCCFCRSAINSHNVIELCHLYPCPCPSQFVEPVCMTK